MLQHSDPAYWSGLMKQGLTKLFLFRALLDGRCHGYELVRRAERLSHGVLTPTEGTVYPVLREWEREGLVVATPEEVKGRQRRVYRLTASGREAFEAALMVWGPAARAVVDLTRGSEEEPERLADYLL